MPVVFDLPMPPSVNRIWAPRKGGGQYRSDRYRTWRQAAGNLINAVPPAKRRPISGHFVCTITLNASKRRGDADNRIKACLDLLQAHGLITNDSLCDEVTAGWGVAPEGCRVVVHAVVAEAA